MANRKTQDSAKPVEIPFATYTSLCRVMDELAFRGPAEEALMMRVAKAGGITEVMTQIKRRRIYGKKMADARSEARYPDVGPESPRPRKLRKVGGGRRRGDRRVKAKLGSAGADAGASDSASAGAA